MENETSFKSLLERNDIPIDARKIIRKAFDRLKTEQSISKRYLTLYNEVPIGLYRTTPGGEILEANPYLVHTLGYESLEDLQESNLEKNDDHFNPSYPRSHFKQRIETEGTITGLEASWQKKDGSFIYVRENARAIRNELGNTLYYEGSIEDITEKKEAEEELRQSEKRFRKLVDTSPDVIALTDLGGDIVMINSQGENRFGYNKQELIGMNILQLIIPEDKEVAQECISNILEFNKMKPIELTFRINDESSLPVEMYPTVISNEKGNPENLMMTIRDITERKKAEAVREEFAKRRDNFVWTTNHELRTPLTVLSGYTELLGKQFKILDQSMVETILKIMMNNINRLERLASDVTSVSTVVQGTLEINKKEVNLLEFLQETVEAYQHLLPEQFELSGSIDESLSIAIDKYRIQQVIDNILNNAIKNTHSKQRKIIMTVKDQPSDVEIVITDNGAGIDPSNIERIFAQFVSIETEYSVTGTGIGLFLSREIITAHGGTIAAHSDGVGHGSQFIITINKFD